METRHNKEGEMSYIYNISMLSSWEAVRYLYMKLVKTKNT